MSLKRRLRSDVRELESLYRSRGRESLYDYCSATFEKRSQWAQRMKLAEFNALAENTFDLTFDERIKKSRMRLLIELSCDADRRVKPCTQRQ
jgi:hypothetical protein